jgi:hypothetical protein
LAAYPPIFPGKNLKTKRLNGGWRVGENPTFGSTFRIANSRGIPSLLGKLYFVWNQVVGRNWREFSLDTAASGAGFMLSEPQK